MKGDVYGNVYPEDITTEAKILTKYPNAKKYIMTFGSNEFMN